MVENSNDAMIMFAVLFLITLVTVCFIVVGTFFHKSSKSTKKLESSKTADECDNIPQFKPLTAEQIEDIHSRGKITPAEKVKEWERNGLCAPGDAIEGAADRCRKFHNCHNCLVDYANRYDEYSSFSDCLKPISTIRMKEQSEFRLLDE